MTYKTIIKKKKSKNYIIQVAAGKILQFKNQKINSKQKKENESDLPRMKSIALRN